MLIVDTPWTQQAWALPFLTVLAPSERYDQQRRRKHHKVLDKAAAMARLVRWWLPDRGDCKISCVNGWDTANLSHSMLYLVNDYTR